MSATATSPGATQANRRWTREETRARAEASPAFQHPSPSPALLADLVAGYEHITGDLVRTTPKRNYLAAAYRVHGDEFLPLVQRRFAATGTATNLLGEIRNMPPSGAPSPAEEASVDDTEETPDETEETAPDSFEPLPGLIYSAANRPPFDPTSNRRYDRRPSNPDAAGFFDDEVLGTRGHRSRTDEALSR